MLRRFPGWTVADVADACDQRIQAAGMTYPAAPAAAVSFLRWLLADADPARPPRQMAHAAQLAGRPGQRPIDARPTLAGRPGQQPVTRIAYRDSAGRRAAVDTAAAAAAVRRARDVDQLGTVRLARAAAEAAAGADEACVGCGAGDAAPRRTPAVVMLCPACWAPIAEANGLPL